MARKYQVCRGQNCKYEITQSFLREGFLFLEDERIYFKKRTDSACPVAAVDSRIGVFKGNKLEICVAGFGNFWFDCHFLSKTE